MTTLRSSGRGRSDAVDHDSAPYLEAVVHRDSDRQWLERAEKSRKLWVRRRLSLAAVLAVSVLGLTFILNEGPRRSGILDALGLTCGEYLTEVTTEPAEVFQPWEEHSRRLEMIAADHPDGATAFDSSRSVAALEHAAQAAGYRPVAGGFRGWTPPERDFSAAAMGGHIVVGHHDDVWTVTDRVSVLRPDLLRTEVTVELEHPRRKEWQPPERLLYAVGATEHDLVLQTPSLSGDTDIVTVPMGERAAGACLRLEGDVDPVEVLQNQARAWQVVMDLNLARFNTEEFAVLHGLTGESGGQTRATRIRVANGEIESLRAPDAYPPEGDVGEARSAIPHFDEAAAVAPLEVKPVDDTHLLLEWEHGYVVLELQ